MMEESSKLELEGKKEALRLQKELNELDLLQKEKKVQIDGYNVQIKKLEVLEKEGKITHKQKMDKNEYKKSRAEVVQEYGKTAHQFRWTIGTLFTLVAGGVFLKKRCDWFPAVCDWFDTNQWDDSKSKGGGKKDINDY
jgi:hypothetical protein